MDREADLDYRSSDLFKAIIRASGQSSEDDNLAQDFSLDVSILQQKSRFFIFGQV